MTIKIYVSKDPNGREWGPDYVHEMEGVVDLLRRLWSAYHHHAQLYAVIVNLHKPASADFVLITERGLGVLDLKHHAGLVVINHDGSWYAGDVKVSGGANGTPPSQVYSYAERIRNLILPVLFPLPPVESYPEQPGRIKIQTGVIFTNPGAQLSTVRQQIQNIWPPPWVDRFSVLAPREIVPWAASLRFNLRYGPERNFESYRLEPARIDSLVCEQFQVTEWTEILPSMPGEKPYAYLKDIQGKTIYELDKDTIILGRSSDCDIVLPAEYGRVSRHHCKIVRRLDRVELHDLDSKHGTYIEGRKLTGSAVLTHKEVICLGGESIETGNCALRFVVPEQTPADAPATPSTVLSADKTI